MKIAIAQLNFLVGDIAGNAAKIESAVRQAESAGAELLLTSELALTGYPPRDILLNSAVIARQERAVKELAGACRKTALLLGWARKAKAGGKPLHNSASLIYRGKILATHDKILLPFYDVFDEQRYFEPGSAVTLVKFKNLRFALTICEDIWNDKTFWARRNYRQNPLEALRKIRPDACLNISASPYWVDKPGLRRRMIAAIARGYRMPVVYANLVGGNDELVFDGAGMAFDAQGRLLAGGPMFKEGLLYVDIPVKKGAPSLFSYLISNHYSEPAPLGNGVRSSFVTCYNKLWPPFSSYQQVTNEDLTPLPSSVAQIYDALVLGLRDYVVKCGFSRVTLGLSGGIDSALVAAIAADALGPGHVLGVSMPSRYSSSHSKKDAQILAKNLGIHYWTVLIEPVFKAYLKIFKKIFAGLSANITEENIQSRIRGAILMAISNKLGHMVLATGNKSELAMGYCTLYGDLLGGLSPISDLPKTLVYQVARYRNSISDVIPERVFTKAPSAELKPNQTDQDSLPPYDLLDRILDSYVVKGEDCARLVKKFPKKTALKVLKGVDSSEFKRRQAPPGLKISHKAFGFGRRMPIACKIEHS